MVRSAFAELLGRHLNVPGELSSIATTYRNDGLYPETHEALLARGIPEATLRSFRPTHMEDARELFVPGSLFLCMTQAHRQALADRGPAPAKSDFFLALLGTNEEIPDPVLDGADFETTFRVLERGVRALKRELELA